MERVLHQLLLNFTSWINRKDAEGHNLFEGGFLGIDDISVDDRSRPLAPGFSLGPADATGWMAMFSLNMPVMALELCAKDAAFEDIATLSPSVTPSVRDPVRAPPTRQPIC